MSDRAGRDLGWILRDVLLFVPLGFLVARGRGGLRGAVLGGVLLSLAIEVAQLWIPGRATSALDRGANALGALAGGLLALRISARRSP